MHSDIPKLLQLEEIDREIARLRAEVAALPRRVAEIETQLAGIHEGVERNRQALKEIEATRRKREGDIQSLQQKISKYRDQMLAVKTNQEYKALGNEINFAEQEIRLIEDKILEGMIETERHERELKAAEIEQKKQQAEVEKEKSQARARTDEDQKRLNELGPQREALRKEIDPDHVRHYDRVLKLRGSAMGEAREQRCLACHVQLRPQVFLDIITAEEFLICDSCGRILFFIPANNPGVAGPNDRKETEQAIAAEVPDPS
jgi:hypothetical protein